MTTIFDFESPSDYTLVNISVSDDIASLTPTTNPGQTFSETFESSSGFTFNSANTSIAGGVLSQISYLISPTLVDLVNATAAAGSLTSTSTNASGYSTQALSSDGYVGFTANTATASKVVGLSRTNPNGNYAGINFGIDQNAGQLIVIESGNGVLTTTCTTGDLLEVKVSGTTVTYYQNGTLIYTSLVAATFPLGLAVWIGTSGITVTGLVFQTGDTQYLGDLITFPVFNYSGIGSIVGWTGFTTGGDTNAPGYILNGQFWNGSSWVSSNHSYAQSSPLATVVANLATLPNNNTLLIRIVTQSGNNLMSVTGPLVVTYSGQIYSNGTIESNSSFTAQALLSFASLFSESGSDTVTFALAVNGSLMYWTGTAWAPSNGTLAQTNTAAVLNANVATLLSVNSSVQVYALLTSASGTTTPNITSMTVQYNFGGIEPSPPLTTIVFGFLRNITSQPVAGASIIFALVTKTPNAYMSASSHVLVPSTVIATTDENGYFEQPVIATTQFQGTDTFIQVTIQSGTATENVDSTGAPLYLTIPVQESIDITSILNA